MDTRYSGVPDKLIIFLMDRCSIENERNAKDRSVLEEIA